MTQNNTGGYCNKCDTVWAYPGKCKCDKDDENNNQITREMVGIKNEREEVLAKVWWNAAIEKAAEIVIESIADTTVAKEIRKLKI